MEEYDDGKWAKCWVCCGCGGVYGGGDGVLGGARSCRCCRYRSLSSSSAALVVARRTALMFDECEVSCCCCCCWCGRCLRLCCRCSVGRVVVCRACCWCVLLPRLVSCVLMLEGDRSMGDCWAAAALGPLACFDFLSLIRLASHTRCCWPAAHLTLLCLFTLIQNAHPSIRNVG